MSSAEALLNSLADEQLLSETNTETTHFVIGEDRYITVPESLKRIAVQYDHNMETITFDCPRHWDGRDMSLMKIYINYILPNSSTGTYIAENITVDKDDFNIMHFDWTIKNHVTQHKGNIKFLVCVRKTDDNGVQTNHWNSELCTDCYISEGLETGSITNKQYSDLATQLLTMIGNAETTIETTTQNQIKTIQNESKTQQAAVEAKGAATLATIPEDYTATSNTADKALRTRANAIELQSEGDIVALTDSSNDLLLGLQIFGRTDPTNTTGSNLLSTESVGTFLNNSGSQKTGICVPITTTGKYTYYIGDKVTTYVGYTDSLTSNATHFTSALSGCPVKGTVSLTAGQYFLLWFDSNVTFTSNCRFFLGLGENLSYEPYTGGVPGPSPDYPITINNGGVEGSININVYNKNLFVSSVTTYVMNGITIEQNPDGSFHVYGTATQLSIPRVANLTLKAGKTYILSGGSQSAQVTVRDTSATMHYATSYGDPTTFTAAENTSVSIYIRVDTGITVDTVIYPMLQLGDFEDTTFESSAGRQTLTLITPTGLPGMDELSVYDVIDLKRGVHVHNVGRANLADYQTL